MCAMRLFTQAEEQIEANVQRNDDIGSDDEDKDEDGSDGSINDVATGHLRDWKGQLERGNPQQ